MNQLDRRFNAWRDPWVPAINQADEPVTLSLRELFETAHTLRDLGAHLTPLDRDSMYRFLAATGAVIAREMPDDELESGEPFDANALNNFEVNWIRRFELTGERPFMQRWDRSQADLIDLPKSKQSLPLVQLHPHEPGDKSSQWAVRLGSSSDLTWPEITLLLITAWFQTRNGNAQDPWGGKTTKGSAATWHTSPLAVHYTNSDNLLQTILANTPLAWLDSDEVPVFLDHNALSPDVARKPASAKNSVARFTYSKSIPLIKTVNGIPTSFVLGPDATIAIPPLGKDDKESLGLVHAHDHTRLYVTTGKNSDATKPRGALRGPLSTTEGLAEWVNSDRGIEFAIEAWKSTRRVVPLPRSPGRSWELSVLSDVGDVQGNRQWASWDTVPLVLAAPHPALHRQVQRLLGLAREFRSLIFSIGQRATGDSSRVPSGTVLTGQRGFYNNIYSLLLRFVLDAADAPYEKGLPELRVRQIAVDIRKEAVDSFEVATAPLLTPRQAPSVAKARAAYRRAARKAFLQAFPAPPTESEVA